MNIEVKKFLFELRFDPLPTILDKRGEIANLLLKPPFTTWNIGANRIDISSKDNRSIGMFVTYHNFGLAAESPNDEKTFSDETKRLIKELWTIIPPTRYVRMGIRINTYIPSKKNFQNLFTRFKDKFLATDNFDLTKFGGELVDVGVPLNFESNLDNTKFNVSMGAMRKDQALQFFTTEKTLAKTGFFVDIDYFCDNLKEFGGRQSKYIGIVDAAIEKDKSITTLIKDLMSLESNG